MTNSPVAIIIYNRPETTKNLLKELKKVGPGKVYIIADGPKDKNDKKLTDQVRREAENNIFWNCKVIKIYAKKNMGLKNRVVTGLNKVFKDEETAIILEDDCVPDSSFFKFCNQLLEKYKNNNTIFSISGTTHSQDLKINKSYYFSKHFHSWGWATWKRAWDLYDDNLNGWPKNQNQILKKFKNPLEKMYWKIVFNMTKDKKIDSWAYGWTYSHLKNNALSIIPQNNLVKNIGFGKNSTHNKLWQKQKSLEFEPVKFPMNHPKKISINHQKDDLTNKNIYLTPRSILGLLYKVITS